MIICEAYNGISALLVDKSKYDGIWVSSLTHSSSKGLPDNELVSLKDRALLVEEIKNVSKKPIIVDIDTGGSLEHLPFNIKWFSDAGAWAIVMEDKCYPKQNSLLEDGRHKLEDVDIFCQKIKVAKEAAGNMKVFARLESLIAKHSVYDALIRAEAYVNAGVDGILIHSKEKVEAVELMDFSEKFREKYNDIVLIAIPTTYKLPENHPFNIIIHANHLFRASVKGMMNYLDGKEDLVSVNEIFDLCGH